MPNVLVFLIGLVLILPVVGELWRLPLGGFDLLPSDILLPIFFGLWVLWKIKSRRIPYVGAIGKAIFVFIGIAFVSFFLNALRFPFLEMVHAGAYLVRLVLYLSLYFVVNDVLKGTAWGGDWAGAFFLHLIVFSAFLLSFFGFIQLYFFPSFLDLGLDLYGWDPHDYRLLSTWFDPNFVAGFLAFAVSFVGVLLFHPKTSSWLYKGLLILTGSFILCALYWTYSRSGYLAFAAVLAVWAILRSPKLFLGLILIFFLGLVFSSRFQERVTSAWHSGQVLIGLNTQYPLDPTARLRVDSWAHALEIIQEHPWIGIGYNRYPFELNQRGYTLLSDHAAGGSDSSLLTIWATTGIFGLLAYLAIFGVAVFECFRFFLPKRQYPVGTRRAWSLQGIGVLAALSGLLVHSIFVNSLLLPWMMIYLWTTLALLSSSPRQSDR